MPDILTVDQLADLLDLNPETIRRHCHAGRLPHHRVGVQYRFVLSEVLAATAKHMPSSTPTASVAPDFDALADTTQS